MPYISNPWSFYLNTLGTAFQFYCISYKKIWFCLPSIYWVLDPINKAAIQEGKLSTWIEQVCRWGLSVCGRHLQGSFLTALMSAWEQCLSGFGFHRFMICEFLERMLSLFIIYQYSRIRFLKESIERKPFHTHSITKLLLD